MADIIDLEAVKQAKALSNEQYEPDQPLALTGLFFLQNLNDTKTCGEVVGRVGPSHYLVMMILQDCVLRVVPLHSMEHWVFYQHAAFDEMMDRLVTEEQTLQRSQATCTRSGEG